MDGVKNQICEFLSKCEEMKSCKFIMATTKIKDLLKAIVNSAELYELFNTVAANFDYMAAKQRCFIESDNGIYGSCRLVLPDTVGDRLAFIFCLLVEFDRDDVNFNAFLQKYYPKDGSYYSSYHLFCDEVIGSLEAIICDIFAKELGEEEASPAPQPSAPAIAEQAGSAPAVQPDAALAQAIGDLCMLIEGEKNFIDGAELTDEDKTAGKCILEGLVLAVKNTDAALVKALTCGYNYFAICTKCISGGIDELFNCLGEFVEII